MTLPLPSSNYQIHIPCLICNTVFVKYSNVEKSPNVVEVYTKVFNSCSKYLNVDISRIEESLNWNFSRESLPFCEICFLTTNKLQSFHEQIETLQLEVNGIVDELKASLTKSHQITQTNGNDRILTDEEKLVQDKITNYRELVLFGKSVYRSQRKLSTRSTSIKTNSENGQCNSEMFDINSVNDFSDGGEDFLDDYNIELDIKYEPASPEYFDPLESGEYADVVESSANHLPSKGSRENLRSSSKKNTSNPDKGNQNTETYSDNMVQLLNLYQMNTKIPVIKLHRIDEGKKEQKSDTKPCIARRKENWLINSGVRPGPGPRSIRTVYTSDGRKLCGGIYLNPTPDGREQCGECDKIYSDAKKLARHIKVFHLGIKEKGNSRQKADIRVCRVTETPEGKKMYRGVEIKLGEHGYFQCTACTRQCPSLDAVMRHIRWYHLGDAAAQLYHERRQAYRIKRQKALGKPVSKQKIKEAEEILRKKVNLETVISPIRGVSVKVEPKKEPSEDTNRKDTKSDKKSKKPKLDSSDSEVDTGESEEESHFNIDRDSNDPDFSPEQCEYQEVHDSESDNKSDSDDNRKRKETRSYERGCKRISVVRRTDGTKLCGGIEFTANDDKTEWKCGKENCGKIYNKQYAVCRHIKSAHLGKKESQKPRKARKRKPRSPNATVEKKKSERRERRMERPHFTSDGLLFNGILSKKVEKGFYQCGFDRSGDKCGKTFPTSFATLAHIKTVHMNTKVASLEKLKCLRSLKTPDGNIIYGNVEIIEPDSNTVECGACNRRWGYKTGNKRYLDNIFAHIRMYHLGEKATEMYRQKRRAHKIKNMKKLGRLVRKKDLIEAEEILKNKMPITAQVFLDVDANGEPLLDKSDPTIGEDDLNPKDKTGENNDSKEEEDLSEYYFSVDEDSDGGDGEGEDDENPLRKDKLTELTKTRSGIRLKFKDGKRFCGDVELIEREGGRQQCERCKKVYPNIPSLSRHIKGVHYGFKEKSPYFKPKIENVDFFRVIEDNERRKTYAGVDIVDTRDGNIACGLCLRSFKILDHFRRHVRSQHLREKTESNTKSDATDATATSTVQVNHSRTYFTREGLFYSGVLSKKLGKGRFLCGHPRKGQPPCRRVLSSTFTLVGHIRREHVIPIVEKPLKKFNRTITTEDGKKMFLGVEIIKLEDGSMKCGGCQKIFTAKQMSGLQGHIMRIHEQKEGGIYICKYCGRNCGSQCWLELHELKHLDERKYVCDQCGLAYKQASSLTHHTRQVHKGIKRHTCDICGKQYYHTRDFITHQRRHKGEKPFVCCHCAKTFYNIYDLKVHERSHTGTSSTNNEKPQSEECSSNSKAGNLSINKGEKSDKRRSTRKRTADEALECNYCDKSFRTATELKKHMSQQHSGSDSDSDGDESFKASSENEAYIPNSLIIPKSKVTSAIDPSFPMPSLENMKPSTTPRIDYSTNSFRTNGYLQQKQDSGPPKLLPISDFMTPTFPAYGCPHSQYQ